MTNRSFRVDLSDVELFRFLGVHNACRGVRFLLSTLPQGLKPAAITTSLVNPQVISISLDEMDYVTLQILGEGKASRGLRQLARSYATDAGWRSAAAAALAEQVIARSGGPNLIKARLAAFPDSPLRQHLLAYSITEAYIDQLIEEQV